MNLELHMLQNVPPANLNRDDTGEPKSAVFGGVRRARVSSQCWKRAIRRDMGDTLGEMLSGTRTLKVVQLVADRLVARGRSADESALAAGRLFESVGIIGAGKAEAGKSSALLFLGFDETEHLADAVEANWDVLVSAKEIDKKTKPTLKTAVEKALEKSDAVDLATFGRMIATLPGRNVDGALQVAHAISTNRLEAESDWFTAVDDLASQDEKGAAMIESTGYNSACFYRYMVLDIDALVARIGAKSAREAVAVFIASAVSAMPTGKRTSTAPHSRPSFVMAVVRDGAALSLANAFVKPVKGAKDGLVAESVAALDSHWDGMAQMYGVDDVKAVAVATTESGALSSLAEFGVPSVKALSAMAVEAAFGEAGKA